MGTNAVQNCTAVIISSVTEIRDLHRTSLFPDPLTTLSPSFFLASINPRMWTPRVVVLKSAGAVVGVVYTKELTVAGIKTGILYGDNTLGMMLIADPADRPELLRIGLGALLRCESVRGIRLLMPPDGFELDAIKSNHLLEQVEVSSAPAENHSYLALHRDYETFLRTLGPRTRRNLRYYRRRFVEEGHTYIPEISIEDLRESASAFSSQSVIGSSSDGIKRALNMFSCVRQPWFAGLRHRDGSCLSVIGGWREADDATLFLQMNDDRKYPAGSLSLVMRGYVIEDLIAEGVPRLRFWAGASGALARYVTPVPARRFYIDRSTISWRIFRSSIQFLGPLFPSRADWIRDWITPSSADRDEGLGEEMSSTKWSLKA
jgi:hypothetical protein